MSSRTLLQLNPGRRNTLLLDDSIDEKVVSAHHKISQKEQTRSSQA